VTFDDQEYLRRYPFIERVLISSDEIQKRVRQLGNEISGVYQGSQPIFVCILKGAYPFLADLTREALTFDDVLLVPGVQRGARRRTSTPRTASRRRSELHIPLLSRRWTPVTEAAPRSPWRARAASA
jgi:hypothetical protein